MADDPRKEAAMPNEVHIEATGQPADVVNEQPTPMENLRDANEHLTLATLQAHAEAEASAGMAEQLRALVTKLEASETALREKNEELENFHDTVVGRELKMMRLEKENEQLRREVDRLRSEAHTP
jgi:predicted mannosyl-3-phosphoglycerate phosphatase (HAD superfamily)